MIQCGVFCDICGKPIYTSIGGGRFDMNYWDAIKTINTSVKIISKDVGSYD